MISAGNRAVQHTVTLADRTDTPDEGGLTVLLHRKTSRSRTAILDNGVIPCYALEMREEPSVKELGL